MQDLYYLKIIFFFFDHTSFGIGKPIFLILVSFIFNASVFADYTVGSGVTVDATTLTGYTGVLTINGTVQLNSNVSLPNITSVIINSPTGNIFWNNNSDIIFSAGTLFVVNNPGALSGVGLQPTTGAGNSSQRLIIGGAIIAVSSDNSTLGDFSFEDFNAVGGLPQFTIIYSSPACSGSAISFSLVSDKLAPSGKSYVGNWSVIEPGFTFNPTTSVINLSSLSSSISNITLPSGAFTVSCLVKVDGKTLADKSVTVIVKKKDTWLGFNTNWNDAQNWCPGVPANTSDVTLPSGLSYYPIIESGQTAFTKNIFIDPGASVTINSGGTINTAGNFANSGTLTNNGTIKLTGTGNQSFPGNSGTINAMSILEVNSTSVVTLNKSFDVTTELRPTSGTLALTDHSITLKSTATNTASVSAVGSTITYGTGQFIVERYISTGGRWQYLAVPTDNSTQTFKDAWQEGATSSSQDPTPGYGMHITAPTANAGFDAYTPRHSVKLFNEYTAPDGWELLPGTNNKLNDYKSRGIMAFVRNNRAVDPLIATAGPTTLRTKGKLFTGNQVVPLTGEFVGVANPYASSIDLTKLNMTGLKNVIYVWDPTLGGAYGAGGYQTLTLQGSDVIMTPGAGAYAAGSPNLISSGQAFIVVTSNASNGSITFEENDKATQNNLVTFAPGKTQKLAVKLYQSLQGKKILLDGMLTLFEVAANNLVDGGDGVKMKNPGENNTGWRRDGQLLSLERRQPITGTDTLYISLGVKTAQKYEWNLEMDNLQAEGLEAVLEDLYLDTKTKLKLTGNNSYSFDVDDLEGSRADNRFRIILTQKAATENLLIVGKKEYSPSISVYPNPVVNKNLKLKFTNEKPGHYSLQLNNQLGQVMHTSSVSITKGDSYQSIQLPGKIAPGNYLLKITNANGYTQLLQVVL